MRKLFQLDLATDVTHKIGGNEFPNPLIINNIYKNGAVKKNIIPHYNFKSWGKNIPQERLLVVYGRVYIELIDVAKKNENGDMNQQTYIHFKDLHTGKLITSCIKPHGLRISDGKYCAVILGKCREYQSKGNTYYNLWVNFPIQDSVLFKSL